MNDDENNPQPQPWIDPALEARIVAHVLGETSAFEAAELERLLTENPELVIFKRRIEAVHTLVGSAVRPGNPKIQLLPERRKKLLETIGVPSVTSDKKIRVVTPRRPTWWSPQILLRVAACLVMTTMVLAIFSSVTLFRNPAEPPIFEGASGAFASASFTVGLDDTKPGRAASPLAADEGTLGATSSAGGQVASGPKPQTPSAYDLSGNNTYSGGTVVTTGVVTTTQPASQESKKVAVWNQAPEKNSLIAAVPTARRYVSSWDDDAPQLAQSIAASETEYGRLPPPGATIAAPAVIDANLNLAQGREPNQQSLDRLSKGAEAIAITQADESPTWDGRALQNSQESLKVDQKAELAQAKPASSDFKVFRKGGDGKIPLQNNVPAPAAAPQGETLSPANQLALAMAEKESAGQSQGQAIAQLAAAAEKTEELASDTRAGLQEVQQQLAAVDESQTGVVPDGSKTTIVSEYLNGAPDSDQVAKAKPAAGWDRVYMFRGVNVLAGKDAELKSYPAEVTDRLAKNFFEAEEREKVATPTVTVWDGQTSVSGGLATETTGETIPTEGRDGTLGATLESSIRLSRSARLLPSAGGAEGALHPIQESDSPEASKLAATGGNLSASTAVSANSVDALLFGVAADATQDTDRKSAAKALALATGVETDSDHLRAPQAYKDAVPMLGDVPLAGRMFREESKKDIPSSSLAGNVINQPVFSTRDGKVEFDGFINYGSPITTVQTENAVSDGNAKPTDLASAPVVTAKTGQLANTQVVREFEYPAEFQPPTTPTSFETAPLAVGKTKELLKEAEGYLATGRHDLASKRYQQMLSEDPSNSTAREGLAAVNTAKTKYPALASNETQSQMVLEATTGWERPARRFQGGRTTSIGQTQHENGGDSSINRKLDSIIIPRIDFRNVTVREALEFLKQRSKALDVSTESSDRKGVNIVLQQPSEDIESQAKITLEITEIPLRAALEYVAQAAGLKLKVDPYAAIVAPKSEAEDGRDGSPSRPSTSGSENPPYQPPSETLTAQQPVSTFSLHVSDVSFQLAKDALAKGAMPDPARIRPEEFYNAFDYNDPAPAPGEEVACRIEQCAHPSLQQRNLVRIAVKAAAAGRAAGQPLRLTILLDTSGSMEREDRAASVRQALQTLTTLLGPNDRVTLIGFARTPRLLAEQVPGDQAGKLVETADRTPSEGGTNLEEALALASQMALKQKLPAAQNRIVLLTDGAANLGNADPVRLAKQIEKTRQQGISFDACGVGANGLNDEMLEALTRKGDGRYYFLNKPGDADAGFAKQLAGAFRPAAENVKVQVVFNPARVSQYRLIGFEKHLLKKEDFRNDKVQAAELSAEEAGVALYQIEALPEGDGELGQVFVRFRDPATGQMVEHSWTMPYEAQVRSFDQASPSLQLAATAALVAEKLQGNAQVDLDALKPVVNNLRGHYPDQARVRELIAMFERLKQ